MSKLLEKFTKAEEKIRAVQVELQSITFGKLNDELTTEEYIYFTKITDNLRKTLFELNGLIFRMGIEK